jgi:hypothetical protein
MREEHPTLFGDNGLEKWYEQEWQDMPDFSHKDLRPNSSLLVHFRCEQDRNEFANLVRQRITSGAKYIWYPEIQIEQASDKLWVDSDES